MLPAAAMAGEADVVDLAVDKVAENSYRFYVIVSHGVEALRRPD